MHNDYIMYHTASICVKNLKGKCPNFKKAHTFLDNDFSDLISSMHIGSDHQA